MTILGVWIIASNLLQDRSDGAIPGWVFGFAAIGAIGGSLYLASLDGPDRFRRRSVRIGGWVGMLVLALLPWSFWFVTLALVLLVIPSLWVEPKPATGEITREGTTFTVVREGSVTRVSRSIGDDITLEVVSGSADEETLIRIASDIDQVAKHTDR